MNGICPEMTSVIAGTLPRYGTCWALAPIMCRNISISRWCGVEAPEVP